MTITIAIPKESAPGEHRVALVPPLSKELAKLNCKIILQAGAGINAGYRDEDYQEAAIYNDVPALYQSADIIFKVQPPTLEEIALFKQDTIFLGFVSPYRYPERVKAFCNKNITSFAIELIPRISRAQAMDALSSQATIIGYKAALLAANHSKRLFPMLTTAAGTIRPINVLVIGVGVAGLQAIATARRLGAIVSAYDVRSAVKEQVESLGARMIEINIKADASNGYARELTPDEKSQQQAILAQSLANADIIISTALIPGKPAPRIITQKMVEAMKPGSIIIDTAAESGGNCELTQAGKIIHHQGVMIDGPVNIPSLVAQDASNMYAKNLVNFFKLLLNTKNEIDINWQDNIIAETLLTRAGSIKNSLINTFIQGS